MRFAAQYLRQPVSVDAFDTLQLHAFSALIHCFDKNLESVTLRAGKLSVFEPDGKAIVIHANSDDNITDPSGNSGDRIACGVISKAPARNKKEPKV